MAKIRLQRNVDTGEITGYTFYCSGCSLNHNIGTGWTFNYNLDCPSFTPSVLVRSGHYNEGHRGNCWCTFYKEHPEREVGFRCYRCHSYITEGKIHYLSDCSHALAGTIVEMSEVSEGE